MEKEIISLKRELQKVSTHLDHKQNFSRSSKVLGEIINNQRQSSESFGLGFEQDNDDKDSTSITPNHEAGTRSFANALKSLVKEKDDRKNDQQFAYVNKGVAPYRRPLTTKYQTIFLWHCYFCYNFGHKDAN